MKPIYRSGCEIKSDAAAADFDKVVDTCLDWALRRPAVSAPPDRDAASQTLARELIGENFFFESLLVEPEGFRHWGLIFEHPDSDDERLWWSTEVAVTLEPSGRLSFSCVNLVGNRDGSVTPIRRPPTRPRIVDKLMRLWPCDGVQRMSADAIELADSGESIGRFLELLYDRDRTHPAVLISARNCDDKPGADHERIASALAGLAHTFVAASRFPSLKLRDRLPAQLNCYDGAVRIYWPGFRSTDPPDRHRVWTLRFIKEVESPPYRRPFEMYLLERIAGFAAFTVRSDLPSWAEMRRINRRLQLAQASEQSEFEAIANQYAEANDALERQLRIVSDQAAQLSQDLEQVKNEADTWRQLYEASQQNEAVDEQVRAPVATVPDAMARAQDEFSEQLAFALNSRSEVDTPFNAPEEVFSALAFLATTYRDAKRGVQNCTDLDKSLRAEIEAWRYRGGQSQLTMTTHDGWYRCTYNGKRYWLGEHVGTGSNRDARFTIRIAFAWDAATEKVVIGFIGQHQKDFNT